jgi:hypothetical protein
MNLYDAMTSAGKGGQIAYTIMNYANVSELQAWCINATPAALGPMLMTLSAEANSFEVTSGATASGRTTSFPTSEAQVLQQKIIARIVNWLIQNATENSTLPLAQQQFQNACLRMKKSGTPPGDVGTTYCKNRYKLDQFMSSEVLLHVDKFSVDTRAQYKTHSTSLGAQIDGYCTTDYGSNIYYPTSTSKYTGPAISQ